MSQDRFGRGIQAVVALGALFTFSCGTAADGYYEEGAEDLGTTAEELCQGVQLALSTPGPLPSNGTVDLTASGVACALGETPEYRFSYKYDGGPTTYTEFRGWDTEETATFDNTGLPSGKYTLAVDARNTGSKRSRDSMKTKMILSGNVCPSVTLSASPPAPRPAGSLIGLLGNATCTEGGADYRFAWRPPGASAYVELRGWGTADYDWDTDGLANGSYALQVFARGAGNSSNLEAMRSITYSIADKCATVNASTNPAGPQPVGEDITILASATCLAGATAELQYRFRLKGDSTWTILEPWSTSTSALWETTGLVPGVYQLYIEARAPGVTARQGSKSLYFTLQ